MKKKILASLLAVCLFVGMAVPAFASTTSTVAGDGSKVLSMEFLKKEYELKQDVRTNMADKLRVYESKDKLVIDHQQISWELSGQGTAFTIETDSSGVWVTALEKTGSAKLVAKDDQSGKVTASVNIKAVPNPTKNYALSFKYEQQTNHNVPVGITTKTDGTVTGTADDYTFKVMPITTGNKWTPSNQALVEQEVVADVNDALGLDGSPTDVVAAVEAVYSINLTGLTAGNISRAFGYTVNVPFDADVTDTVSNLVDALNANTSFKALYTATIHGGNTSAITVTAKDAKIDARRTTTMTPIVGGANVAVRTVTEEIKGVTAVASVNKTVVYDTTDDDNNLVFKIPGAVLRTLTADNQKVAVSTIATMYDKDDANGKQVTAKTNFTKVAAKDYTTIACLPSKTIEVGETFDLADTVRKGASNANVNGDIVSYTEEYYNEASEANDYAIVGNVGEDNSTDGEVLGVAVGKNKISVQMENGQIATCTVTVVSKGSVAKPAGDLSLANANPKLIVGGTYTIGVKNAVAGAKIEHTSPYDTKVATVDANGKITAVGVGKTKIVTDVDGVKLYTTVTVTAAPTVVPTPDDKPQTLPPQTGVNN